MLYVKNTKLLSSNNFLIWSSLYGVCFFKYGGVLRMKSKISKRPFNWTI